MASTAEKLIAGQQRSTEVTTGRIGEGIAGLGEKMEQIQQNRAKLEQQKQQLQQQKIEKFSNTILSGTKIKDSRSRNHFFSKFLPKQKTALGLDAVFDQDSINFITSSDENLLKFKGIVSRVGQGELDFQEAIGLIQDPEQFANFEIGAGETQELLKAESGALTREAQAGRFEQREARQQQESRIREERSVRKEEAKLNREDENDILKKSTFITKNGISNTLNTLKELDNLIPGGIDDFKGDIPGFGKTGNAPEALISAEGKKIRQVANELKNSILKMRSGGAVTKEEAARLLAELGMSEGLIPQFKSDKQFVDGIKRVRSKLQDVLATSEAGFNTVVNSEFQTRFKERTGRELSSKDPFFAGKKAKAVGKKAKLPSLEQFNSANADQQKAAAKRLGMSIEELMKKIGDK